MSRIRVLVVDDDREICELIHYRLDLDGPDDFTTTSVSDGFERLLAPGAWRGIDCLVLDLWLTHDGVNQDYPMAHRVFRAARTERPDLPVIIFSAVVGLQHSPDLEREAELVLAKPSIDKITSAILSVCRRRREGDST